MKKPNDKDIESVRQVGQVLTFHVEFVCIVERRVANKRRVNYEVRIDGWPSAATFYVEGDRPDPTLGDSEIEGTCAYVRRFLRDGITDGIETVLMEAYQLTHGGQTPTKKFLTAFLRDYSDYAKKVSEQRLESKVAEKARGQWLKVEASAKCHQRTELLKEYQSDYKQRYRQYVRNGHQTGRERFAQHVWDQHEKKAYGDRSPGFLKYAKLVVAERLTPGQAALEWLSEEMKIPASSLERRYVRKPFSRRRRRAR